MARKVLMDRYAIQLQAESTNEALQALLTRLTLLLDRNTGKNDGEAIALRALWTIQALGGSEAQEHLLHGSENLRSIAIRLSLEQDPLSVYEDLLHLASEDKSQQVRLEIAAGLQRLPLDKRWELARQLLGHSEDAKDHNLPLMYWYGIEPLVPSDPARALLLAKEGQIPLVTRYIVRRAAGEEAGLTAVVEQINDKSPASWQQLILDEMLAAFEGRVEIPMPTSWKGAYEHLMKSQDANVLEEAEQIAVIFGDTRIFPNLRKQLVDAKAPLKQRQRALEVIVRGRDADARNALLAVITTPGLSGAAIRALATYDGEEVAETLLQTYSRLSLNGKRDAIATLTARASSANLLLDAIERGQIRRTELHAYNVRQILQLGNEKLTTRLKATWGDVRESSEAKKAQIASLKGLLTDKRLQGANKSHGRYLFAKTCGNCHKLFGTGGDVGPEITGSNRANLDYILENVIDPSAVLGRDYRMTALQLDDGRVVSGLLKKETDSALTIRTLNDTQVIAKSSIEQRSISSLSMMPERLLEPLSEDETVDLIAYLRSSTQVAMKGPRAPIDSKTGRVPDAQEGESLQVLAKTAGNTRGQDMSGFKADKWSGAEHVWWTGAQPKDELTLQFDVPEQGTFHLELVMTRARDYGIVQLLVDDEPLGGPIDLYHPEVVTTGVITLQPPQLEAGLHKLRIQIVGANEQAAKAYMFGLDYLRLVPAE